MQDHAVKTLIFVEWTPPSASNTTPAQSREKLLFVDVDVDVDSVCFLFVGCYLLFVDVDDGVVCFVCFFLVFQISQGMKSTVLLRRTKTRFFPT
jgi:hypothetical protein